MEGLDDTKDLKPPAPVEEVEGADSENFSMHV